ncbi:hypothetical protein Tco_0951561 [Tanacetum coccineum]|uniref:Uncharacterized protein n=1 Tax=Tanacetum coccineum TaxID=301880 RepID=A0ABQ5DUH1_9ASTR
MGGSSSQQHTHQQLVLDEEVLRVLDEEALRETATTVDEQEIGDEYLTEKQQQQLVRDEEALRETFEEEARAEKEIKLVAILLLNLGITLIAADLEQFIILGNA